MADIQERFGKDMLVLSSPISSELERIGINSALDGPFTLLFEPEVIEEAYRLEATSGAQCVVADTAQLTPARLAHSRMEGDAAALAKRALGIVQELRPQHVLVEIAPCGLPLDETSKASLVENRDQYARAARLYSEGGFDAFFLNGFVRAADLKCALMGIRMVSDAPILASVTLDRDGFLDRIHSVERFSDVAFGGQHPGNTESLEEAVPVMAEYGADVAGFVTDLEPSGAAALARRVADVCALPVLTQLFVRRRDAEQEAPTKENPYCSPDVMVDAADLLRESGVQFLRAVGDATPAYTGALVAATDRLDVVALGGNACMQASEDEDLDALGERLRQRVSHALSKRGF